MSDAWKDVKYFKPEEFDSPDAPGSGSHMDMNFVLKLDKLREILGRQPRAPEKINRGAGEMLERFARDLAARLDRQFISESRFQITERDLETLAVQDRHEPPDDARQSEARFARQQRNQPGREQKPDPLQPITNPLTAEISTCKNAHEKNCHRKPKRWRRKKHSRPSLSSRSPKTKV